MTGLTNGHQYSFSIKFIAQYIHRRSASRTGICNSAATHGSKRQPFRRCMKPWLPRNPNPWMRHEWRAVPQSRNVDRWVLYASGPLKNHARERHAMTHKLSLMRVTHRLPSSRLLRVTQTWWSKNGSTYPLIPFWLININCSSVVHPALYQLRHRS